MRVSHLLLTFLGVTLIGSVISVLPQQRVSAGCDDPSRHPCVVMPVRTRTPTQGIKKKKPTKTETYAPRTRTPTVTETPLATDTLAPSATPHPDAIVPVTAGDSNSSRSAPGGPALPWLLGGGLGLLAGILIGLLLPAVQRQFFPPGPPV